jgi:hypothetical protein
VGIGKRVDRVRGARADHATPSLSSYFSECTPLDMRTSRQTTTNINSKYDQMMKTVALTHTKKDRKRRRSPSNSDSDLNSPLSSRADAAKHSSRDGRRFGSDLRLIKLRQGLESSSSDEGEVLDMGSAMSEVSQFFGFRSCFHTFP